MAEKDGERKDEKTQKAINDTKNLKPIFDPTIASENYPYKDNLKTFILNYPNVTNIALEGDFATGKSTIIQRLLKDKDIKKKKPKIISSISLKTKEKELNNEEAEGTPNATTNITANHSSICVEQQSATPNIPLDYYLQSEVVRLLFYGEKANKLKDVPYRRVRRNYIVLPLVISMLVALGLFTNILR